MIRPATLADIPHVVAMTHALAAHLPVAPPLDDAMIERFAGSLILRRDALALVDETDAVPTGMLFASIERSPLSPAPVAVEHGWYCERPGAGVRLLDRYLAWAREQGAWAVRMSTPPGALDIAVLLRRRGFQPSETAHIKAL
jgi:N-acetylglutamate synthase-like GNAT family acetyltransferase